MRSAKNSLIAKLRRREIDFDRIPPKDALNCDIFERNRDESLYQRDVKGNTGCVNAIEFSPNEDFLVSGGDDKEVRMWSTAGCCVYSDPQPVCSMSEMHTSNIFTLQFSHHTERIYSAGNERRILIHDVATRKMIRFFMAGDSYYRISKHPTNDNVISAACDDGYAYVYDLREDANGPALKICLEGTVYSVDYNPFSPYLLAICSAPDGLSVFDLRRPNEAYARAGIFSKHAICATWHESGESLFCIRSRSSPIYFNLQNSEYIELKDSEYSNLCTVKSNSFAGPNYMITGSDDWNIYVWKVPRVWDDIPDEDLNQAYTVLKGHRSIVNHVRYSERNNIVVSCGVEKIIKCWSAFETQTSYRNPPRRVMVPRTRLFRMYDDSPPAESVEEDPITLQQFDAYYQQALTSRQLNSMNSSSSDDSSNSDHDHHMFGLFDLVSSDNEDIFGNEILSSSDDDDHDSNEDNATEEVASDAEEVEVQPV